jgi:multicomponent Na+:H+ antiporter subunit E
VRRWPALAVALGVLWLFVRGVTLDPSTIAGELLIGLLVGGLVAFPLRRFYADRVDLGRVVRATPWAVVYVAIFVRELLTANVDVAYRVIAPSLPIHPRVVEVPLRVESDLAVTTIANSITLTPGTLTMDHDGETNTLYVHTIAGRDRESVVAPIRTWEDYAIVIFDEVADPDDPVPPRPSARASAPAGEDGAAGREDAGETDRTGADGRGGDRQ